MSTVTLNSVAPKSFMIEDILGITHDQCDRPQTPDSSNDGKFEIISLTASCQFVPLHKLFEDHANREIATFVCCILSIK